jgi:hypothetical protein
MDRAQAACCPDGAIPKYCRTVIPSPLPGIRVPRATLSPSASPTSTVGEAEDDVLVGLDLLACT